MAASDADQYIHYRNIMSTTGIVGLGGCALIVAVLMYFATAQVQAGTFNAIGGETRLTELDLPWVEAGKKALVYSKKNYTFNNGVTERVEWGAGRWRTQSPRKIVAEAFAYLEKIHAIEQWPDSGNVAEFYSDNQMGVPAGRYPIRVAPYQFYLVSIRPTVILMQADPLMIELVQAHTKNPTNSRFSQWMSSLDYRRYLDVWQMSNPIHVSTQIPPGTQWLWFSPEMQQPPMAISLQDNADFAIPISGGKLTFQATASGWSVFRK